MTEDGVWLGARWRTKCNYTLLRLHSLSAWLCSWRLITVPDYWNISVHVVEAFSIIIVLKLSFYPACKTLSSTAIQYPYTAFKAFRDVVQSDCHLIEESLELIWSLLFFLWCHASLYPHAHSTDYKDHCLRAGPICSAWSMPILRCLARSYLSLMLSRICKSCGGTTGLAADVMCDFRKREDKKQRLHQSVRVLTKFGFAGRCETVLPFKD